MTGPEIQIQDENWAANWREFPWWLVAIFGFLVVMVILIITDPEVNDAFIFIIPGITVTLRHYTNRFWARSDFGTVSRFGADQSQCTDSQYCHYLCRIYSWCADTGVDLNLGICACSGNQ